MPMPVTIAAGDLELRRYTEAHGADLAEAVRESGDDLSHYETWAHAGYTDEEGRSHTKSWDEAWGWASAFGYGIWRGARFLGGAVLSGVDAGHRTAAMGYWVRSSETGLGVATAAARALADAAMTHLGLQRIEMMTAVGNTASRRVAEKVGASLEGILRKRQVLGGEPTDCVLYALVV